MSCSHDVSFLFLGSPPQLSMGDGDQGGNEEVPQPHEPQRCGGGRAGPRPGHGGPAPQPPAAQHRVGATRDRESGQSVTYGRGGGKCGK